MPNIAQLQIKCVVFTAATDGHAVISGEWTLMKEHSNTAEEFPAAVSIDADGYPALVRELRTGWQQTTSQLATPAKTAAAEYDSQ